MRKDLEIAQHQAMLRAAEQDQDDGAAAEQGHMLVISGRDVRGDWDAHAAAAAATDALAAAQNTPAIRARVWSTSEGQAITTAEPSRLHKQKHQIQALAIAAQASAAQINESRAAGYRTKAQTWGKYGW